jgi:EpsD family peptidyl-prolyl cis-trans isomerase
MKKLGVVGVACLLGTVLLAGCQREATGQVAAVVNGEEITLQEINAELSQMQVPAGVDKEQVQQAALQRIVDRRLLAQAAREDGLDQSPEYLIRRRQLEDALLVQLLGERTGRTTAVPDPAAVDTFVAENPAIFGGRTIFAVDRIQFPLPSDVESLKALESEHSMDAVAAKLRQMGVEFTRGEAMMDSAQLGQARLDRIRALPEGEPFVIPEGGLVTVAVITGGTPQPVEGDQARPAAAQLMRNESLSDAMRKRLETEKADAEIEYQEGFSLAAASPATTAAE